MLRRTRKRMMRRRGRKIIRKQGQFYIEEGLFSATVGYSSEIRSNFLARLPSSCSWRPLSFEVTCNNAFIESQLTETNGVPQPSSWAPAALQLVMYDPDNKAVATSGLRILNNVKNRVTVRYPRSSDWYPPTNPEDSTYRLAFLDLPSLGPEVEDGTLPSFVRGIIKVRIALKREIFTTNSDSLTMPLNLLDKRTIPLNSDDRTKLKPVKSSVIKDITELTSVQA